MGNNIFGGAGNDNITGTTGNDSVVGFAGDDTIFGGLGNDSLDGGLGNDGLFGGDGNDGLGGKDGSDTLYGGAGFDSLDGGNDNDFIYGGANVDKLYGNAGADTFYLTGSEDFSDSIFGGETGTDNDTIEISAGAFTNIVYGGGANENGTIQWLSGAGGSVIGTTSFTGIEHVTVLCFGSGTLITTSLGPVPVEAVRLNDLVLTVDHGFKPVLWTGSRKLEKAELEASPNMRPIRIPQDALGNGLPERDLIVSPQHRILVRSRIAERMFGTMEVLVAAKHLVGHNGVEIAQDIDEVEYWHFMFDQHEVVFAEGARAESLLVGPEAVKSVSHEALDEILQILPELYETVHHPLVAAARPIVSGRRMQTMLDRSKKNSFELFEVQ
jgi:hypothetical protein